MAAYFFQLAEDSFKYGNVSPLPSPPWTPNTGLYAEYTLQVVGGLCEPTIAVQGIEFYTGTSLPDDQYCSATLANLGANSSASFFLQARATAVQNYFQGDGYFIWVYNQGTGWGASSNGVLSLYFFTNGSGTVLGSADEFQMNPNDVWSLAVIGTEVYVLQNGTQRLSVSDATYASGQTALAAEAGSNSSNVQVSLFTTGAASTTPYVATSTFSPAPGPYSTSQSVELLNADSSVSGFEQFYTTDGTTPTVDSTEYTGAISVNESTTIKVLATASDYNNSEIAVGQFRIIADPPPQVVFGTSASRFGPRISSGSRFGNDRQTGI